MSLPIAINIGCAEKKPDGTPMYGVPRSFIAGRVHAWTAGRTDRDRFNLAVRNYVKALTGKDVPTPGVVWPTARGFKAFLDDYAGTDTDDAEVLAALAALGVDIDAIRGDLADEEPAA